MNFVQIYFYGLIQTCRDWKPQLYPELLATANELFWEEGQTIKHIPPTILPNCYSVFLYQNSDFDWMCVFAYT